MQKRKKPSPDEELTRREKIKRLVIISMFSDDTLMDRLVLKGGNALDLVYRISTRASVDIDLSIGGDFTAEELLTLHARVERALQETFRLEGYRVFDAKIEKRPPELTSDVESFWGGYRVEFKLIESDRYDELKENIEALRKNAVPLGQGPKFMIDISKHEFTDGKARIDFDGYTVFVYTPEMIVCEKLRAICQQMPEYGPVVKRDRAGSPRARDFIDIHAIMTSREIDLGSPSNRKLLAEMFASKRVDLSLLKGVDKYREFHRTSLRSRQGDSQGGGRPERLRFLRRIRAGFDPTTRAI